MSHPTPSPSPRLPLPLLIWIFMLMAAVSVSTESQPKSTINPIACPMLAECYLAQGDIRKSRGKTYQMDYNLARDALAKHRAWLNCSLDVYQETCERKLTLCYAELRPLAINDDVELMFLNDCFPQTIPYSFNLCKQEWTGDILSEVKKYYPQSCSMTCAEFKKLNKYHLGKGETKFLPQWAEGLNLLLNDQYMRALARKLTDEALNSIREGLVRDRSREGITQIKRCAKYKKLISIPWLPPIELFKDKPKLESNVTSNTITIVTRRSSCRVNSWMSYIRYANDHLLFAICSRGNVCVGEDFFQNHVLFSTNETSGRPSGHVAGIHQCYSSILGVTTFLTGVTLYYGEYDGPENQYITSLQWQCGGMESKVFVDSPYTTNLHCPSHMAMCSLTTYVERLLFFDFVGELIV